MLPPKRALPLASISDEQRVVASLRSGDAAAFEAVFRAYAERLCDVANSYVRAPDVAEEIVQDFFMWLWVHRHEFSPQHGLRAYLFGAVRNRALNMLRSDASTRRTNAGLDAPMSEATDSAVLMTDLEGRVQSIIEGMPPRCREVFTLIRVQSLSYADASAILEIAPKTVEIHMSRALAILRAHLGPWLNG